MLLIIGKIVFLLPVSCLSDAMNTFHSKDEKTTSCFLVTSSVKKKIVCVYKSETSRQSWSLKNVSFYFSKNKVIARAPRLTGGTGTWKSFSASLRFFCVTLNSLPERMFVLQCWHVNVLKGWPDRRHCVSRVRKERWAVSGPALHMPAALPALQPLCTMCLSPALPVDLVTEQHMRGSLMRRVLRCSDVWGLVEEIH